ncbi:uncharacterized protein N7503_000225 [Penicillium pulvis]|uniref:uncharacterized protein n=1 Tax=Penicillium pulvis TaxID=1562058 RepID=UPI002546B9E5|nr:uncharacterized protein N7503_000225 [Penicillium pulvis]KAJ5813475.1 hypothetical protein N7503_000225 [Penicillium pulvis]
MAPALPHSQTGVGNGTMAPSHQFQPPSRPSSAQGQQPPKKMRRLYDGSKDPSGPNMSGPNTKPRAKQASKRNPRWVDLVRPLDVNDMFLKDSYDVATIARDVLITAGKHPTEKPLNYHLQCLTKTVPALDHSSDLASLRWDGIDPLIYSRDKRPRNTSTRPPAQPINAIGAVAPPSSHGDSLPPQPSSLLSLPHNSHSAKSNPFISPPPPIPSTPDPAPERALSKPPRRQQRRQLPK